MIINDHDLWNAMNPSSNYLADGEHIYRYQVILPTGRAWQQLIAATSAREARKYLDEWMIRRVGERKYNAHKVS